MIIFKSNLFFNVHHLIIHRTDMYSLIVNWYFGILWILQLDFSYFGNFVIQNRHRVATSLGKKEQVSSYIQSTLPKLNSHKSNNRQSRRSIQVFFSLFYIVFDPTLVEFSLSRSYFFSPNRFDLGRVDCSPYFMTISSDESLKGLTSTIQWSSFEKQQNSNIPATFVLQHILCGIVGFILPGH